MNEMLGKILPYKARTEFFLIFRCFLGQWSFKKNWFWDLLTFSNINIRPQSSTDFAMCKNTFRFTKGFSAWPLRDLMRFFSFWFFGMGTKLLQNCPHPNKLYFTLYFICKLWISQKIVCKLLQRNIEGDKLYEN